MGVSGMDGQGWVGGLTGEWEVSKLGGRGNLMNRWFRVAAFFMFTGVAMGAFGAHGLRARLTVEAMQIFHTAVLYHLVHALGLFAVAWAWERKPAAEIQLAGGAISLGLVIFCGSLYLLAVTGVKWLGAVTPVGGLCFLAGWGLLTFKKIEGDHR